MIYSILSILFIFFKESLNQVPPSLINRTPLRPLKTFLDMVSEVDVLKTWRFPFRDGKSHTEFKFTEMCLGLHTGEKKRLNIPNVMLLQYNTELSVNNQNILTCAQTETRVM